MDVKCNVIKDLLQLYVDGLASEESIEIVEEHLGKCDSCNSYYENLKDDNILEINGDIHISSKVENNLMKSIKRRLFLVKLVSIALGAAVGLYITLFIDAFKFILIFPLIGAAGYYFTKKIWITPLIIFVVSMIGGLLLGEGLSIIMGVLIFAFLTLIGCIILFLINKILE